MRFARRRRPASFTGRRMRSFTTASSSAGASSCAALAGWAGACVQRGDERLRARGLASSVAPRAKVSTRILRASQRRPAFADRRLLRKGSLIQPRASADRARTSSPASSSAVRASSRRRDRLGARGATYGAPRRRAVRACPRAMHWRPGRNGTLRSTDSSRRRGAPARVCRALESGGCSAIEGVLDQERAASASAASCQPGARSSSRASARTTGTQRCRDAANIAVGERRCLRMLRSTRAARRDGARDPGGTHPMRATSSRIDRASASQGALGWLPHQRGRLPSTLRLRHERVDTKASSSGPRRRPRESATRAACPCIAASSQRRRSAARRASSARCMCAARAARGRAQRAPCPFSQGRLERRQAGRSATRVRKWRRRRVDARLSHVRVASTTVDGRAPACMRHVWSPGACGRTDRTTSRRGDCGCSTDGEACPSPVRVRAALESQRASTAA